jgi:hypothetical protein
MSATGQSDASVAIQDPDLDRFAGLERAPNGKPQLPGTHAVGKRASKFERVFGPQPDAQAFHDPPSPVTAPAAWPETVRELKTGIDSCNAYPSNPDPGTWIDRHLGAGWTATA